MLGAAVLDTVMLTNGALTVSAEVGRVRAVGDEAFGNMTFGMVTALAVLGVRSVAAISRADVQIAILLASVVRLVFIIAIVIFGAGRRLGQGDALAGNSAEAILNLKLSGVTGEFFAAMAVNTPAAFVLIGRTAGVVAYHAVEYGLALVIVYITVSEGLARP